MTHSEADLDLTREAVEDRRAWLALYVLCLGALMIVLDSTIVNVALPSIREDLGFTQANLAWVVNAYLITFGGLLLLAGRLGDLVGPRRIFLSGVSLFTLASLACAVAQDQGLLIGARSVQGAGGALTLAVILGLIVRMFPDESRQTRAFGVYTFVAVAGGSIGLIVGGVLTEAINWHWIFYINLPIGLATVAGAVRLVEDRGPLETQPGVDLPGAVLVVSGLMIGVYSILGVDAHGWTSGRTAALAAASAALLAAFVARQALGARPLVPLRLFRSRNLSGANVVQAMMAVGMYGMFFLGALYMQNILGYSALEVGLAYLPMALSMGTMSFQFTARVNARFGARATLIAAMLAIAAALMLFARTPTDAHYVVDLLPPMLCFGVGAGLGFPSLMSLAMTGARTDDSGLASGLVNTSMQLGGAIGLAVLATLASQRADRLRTNGYNASEALNGGYHVAYLTGTALIIVAIIIAITVLRPGRRPAHRTRSG